MLKAIREHKGIKQIDLANRLGISQSYYSKLENSPMHRSRASIVIIEKLASELNVCPIELFLYFLNLHVFVFSMIK